MPRLSRRKISEILGRLATLTGRGVSHQLETGSIVFRFGPSSTASRKRELREAVHHCLSEEGALNNFRTDSWPDRDEVRLVLEGPVRHVSQPNPEYERDISRVSTLTGDHSPINPKIGAARRGRATGSTKPRQKIFIKDRKAIVQYSRILIIALQEVVDYDPERHHNRPPPELRLDGDPDYLAEIRNLIAELRRLNSLLERKRVSRKEEKAAIGILAKCADKFSVSMSRSLGLGLGKTLGVGVAGLVVASLAGLLAQTGIGQDVISTILNQI